MEFALLFEGIDTRHTQPPCTGWIAASTKILAISSQWNDMKRQAKVLAPDSRLKRRQRKKSKVGRKHAYVGPSLMSQLR